MKRLLTDALPSFYFRRGMGDLYTIKVSINGKINGRNRTINHIFFKKIKDKQSPRTHQIYLYVNYGFREVLSKYGIFAIKV
jgi:ribosomal protein S3